MKPTLEDSSTPYQTTVGALPFVAPVATVIRPGPAPLAGFPPLGTRLGDFELVAVLGYGAFACVYLARQTSLERMIALKVSKTRGREARTLARLEHPHIVAIYAEATDAEQDLHLLCMQYVAGSTLEQVMECWKQSPPEVRNGERFLACIDELARFDVALDVIALRDRQRLAEMDRLETVCWLGARLAEALAYAHQQGVLHRDIKPANILLNRYGRPYLADFNVSQITDDGHRGVGGTLAYMAPEHIEAFVDGEQTAPGAQADVYSLGIVLFQLYQGSLPFALPRGLKTEELGRYAQARREEAIAKVASLDAPPTFQQILSRCLQGDPNARYADAGDLAQDLESCQEFNRVRRSLPEPRPLTRWALQSPVFFVAIMIPLPHVLATIVNIAYNASQLQLSERHLTVFPYLVGVYNPIAYSVLLTILFRKILPVYRAWSALNHHQGAPGNLAEMRRKALALPDWLAGLSALGWLPGGIIFPAVLALFAPPVELWLFVQFVVSFTLSGLIAITYSAGLMELLAVRVLYPGLFLETRNLSQTARHELRHVENRLARLQVLAILIPVAGATLMLGVGPENASPSSYQAFRIVVTATLAAGMIGLGLAVYLTAEIRETVARLTGSQR
jgi:serine/threonine protein kinase